jgi:UDP-2,3-diacylglucosamine pyrophosphatase LpxH
MIIITDAHVSRTRNNHTAFFKMLTAIEKTDHGLIFLGDIFDLWIALPRYESDLHHEFVAWCRCQKSERTIGFVEGNHEFYLSNQRDNAFSWCSNGAWWVDEGGLVFAHGDHVNRKDKKYLLFRRLVKSNLTRFLLNHLPYGPQLTESIKRGLKNTNKKFRMQIPYDEIQFFADSRFAEGFDTIFLGHFHQEYCYRNPESKKLFTLPDWLTTHKVTLYRRNSGLISTVHWTRLFEQA